jgi:cell division protein FtsW (lipid II flippase)
MGLSAAVHGLIVFDYLSFKSISLPLVSQNGPALLIAMPEIGLILAIGRSTDEASSHSA